MPAYRLTAALLALLMLATLAPAARPSAAADLDQAPPTFSPLPGSCGGGLPPPTGEPACCLSGYVIVDGRPVAGAKVTVSSPAGSVDLWTDLLTEDGLPYYRADLSFAPLLVAPGDTISVTVTYGDRQRTLTHVAVAGSQQVDLVLPRSGDHDYAFSSQIWQQGERGKFTFPTGVAVASDGTVYIADTGNSRVQVFNRQGDRLRFWGLQGGRAGELAGPTGIAVGAEGAVVVADTFNYRMQTFNAMGDPRARWGRRGSGAGEFRGVSGVAIDAAGNIYAADSYNHRIQKFDSGGQHLETWGGEGSGPGQFKVPVGLALDAAGNIYVADRENHRIQKLSPAGAPLESWGTQGSGPGQLNFPEGVALDGDGNLYVTDWGNNRIQKLDPDGDFVDTWGAFGSGNGQFRGPRGIALDPAAGVIYVVDTENQRVQRFDLAGTFLGGIGGPTTVEGQLSAPVGVATDADGRIYTTEWERDRVQIFSADGQLLNSFGEAGSAPRQFNQPVGVAVDGSGNIYVADTFNRRVQKFNSATDFQAAWTGATVPIIGRVDFVAPVGLAVDSAGNVYVSDYALNVVAKFTPAGGLINVLGLPGTAVQFNRPAGLAVDRSNNLYIVDSGNSRVVKFSAAGSFVRAWGSAGNGPGQFNGPIGAAADADGNIYVSESGPLFEVADPDAHRVQKFTGDGALLSGWGSAGGGPGQFVNPVGLAVAPSGAVLVADSRNNRIQRFRRISELRPVATIVSLEKSLITKGERVRLRGAGSRGVSGDSPLSFEWTITPSGGAPAPLGATAELELNTAPLAQGRYTLSLVVRDSDGRASAPATRQIDVVGSLNPAKTWTFLLYLDADVLPGGIQAGDLRPFLDNVAPGGALYRLINGQANPNVAVLALYDGPGPDDTVRYVIRPDGGSSQEPVAEANMGRSRTLSDFVEWGYTRAQAIWAARGLEADHIYLSIADHANALAGIAWDFTADPDGGERLTPSELRRAMLRIADDLGRPVDVLHLDGCLMGLIETAYQLEGTASYLVASENLAWSAFAYDRYRDRVGRQTAPDDLAARIVNGYAGIVGASNLPYTIAAIDMAGVAEAAADLDSLAEALRDYALAGPANRAQLAGLRAATPPLDSNGSVTLTADDEYVDLIDWLARLRAAVSDATITSRATALEGSLDDMILEQRRGSGSYEQTTVNLAHANGLAIYYPQQPAVPVFEAYSPEEILLADETRWGDFLAAAIDAQPFNGDAAAIGLVPPLPSPTVELEFRVYLPEIVR